MAALVEYPNQVDDRVAPAHEIVERCLVVYVRIAQFEARQYEQPLRALPSTGRNAHRVAGTNQLCTHRPTDEAGAADDANQTVFPGS